MEIDYGRLFKSYREYVGEALSKGYPVATLSEFKTKLETIFSVPEAVTAEGVTGAPEAAPVDNG